MKVIEAIKTRRSIRTFLDTPITADQIIPLLESAMYAPSAHNEQPWQFLIIEDPQLLEKVSKIHEYVKMVETAPIGVLVCGDMKKDIANGFWVQDCSASTQNLLLAIHNAGFWAVWTWIYPQQELIQSFSTLFNLPADIVPFAFIPIWYPAEEGKVGNRFKQEKIHINKR